MIALQVNGRPVELPAPTSLLDYLQDLDIDPRAVAVEVNGEILERETYAGRTLQDGDAVEIVRMVGGGAGCGSLTRAHERLSRGRHRPFSA